MLPAWTEAVAALIISTIMAERSFWWAWIYSPYHSADSFQRPRVAFQSPSAPKTLAVSKEGSRIVMGVLARSSSASCFLPSDKSTAASETLARALDWADRKSAL